LRSQATGWLHATLDILDSTLGPQFAERVTAFGSRDRYIKLRGVTTSASTRSIILEIFPVTSATFYIMHF
jgi:hypothetical protein